VGRNMVKDNSDGSCKSCESVGMVLCEISHSVSAN
jgi:hypothetical protein